MANTTRNLGTKKQSTSSQRSPFHRKGVIGIVEDTKGTSDDLIDACERTHECHAWHSYMDARGDLLIDRRVRPDLLLIDCCLEPLDQGDSAEGIQLARDLCKERSLRGTSIFMFTKFATGDTLVREELETLLSSHKACVAEDLQKSRRIINKDVAGCVRHILASEILTTALDRRKALGPPPL